VSTGYEPGAELNSTPTISICYCLSSAPVPVDRANISLCLSFLLCLVVHWTESTPSSSASLIFQPPPLDCFLTSLLSFNPLFQPPPCRPWLQNSMSATVDNGPYKRKRYFLHKASGSTYQEKCVFPGPRLWHRQATPTQLLLLQLVTLRIPTFFRNRLIRPTSISSTTSFAIGNTGR